MAISNGVITLDKQFFLGFIKVHILYHASRDAVFGAEIADELGRHGYKLSPGTLYPLLHALEERGYLRAREERVGRTARRLYRATASGRRALAQAKEKVRELFGELLED